jgi:pullulanase/glycogen debranching enzyme
MAYVLEQRTSKTVGQGLPYPLGATPTITGVNFALYSMHADEVFLLLFDAADQDPTDVIRLDQRTKYVWHALVQDVRAVQLYAYKVRGDHRPAEGLRFNEHKLLIDSYARALTGPVRNPDNLLLAYDTSAADADLSLDTRDDTAVALRRKNSSEAIEGAMQSCRKARSVSRLNPSCERIAARRFHEFDERAQTRRRDLVRSASRRRMSPRRRASAST